jgi:hypothetical protein
MHIRRLVTVLTLATAGIVSAASPALAWATTLCVCPTAIVAHVGEQFGVTLTATNADNAGRTYRIRSTDLHSYSSLVSCAGSPVAVTPGRCTTDSTTGYTGSVPVSAAASGENVTFTLLATAVHATDTVTAEVLVGGIVKATATFTITVLAGHADLRVASASAGRAGARLAVVFFAGNSGPSADPHAVVTVNADPRLGTVVSATGDATFACAHHDSVATCTATPLASSAGAWFEVDYLPNLLALGGYVLTVSIAGTDDPDLSNNQRTLHCTFVTGILSGCD